MKVGQKERQEEVGDPVFDLQDSLPYLIARAGTRTEASFKPSLEAYDLSIEMWRVLATLAAKGSMSLRRLSAETSINPSTLSRQADRMVKRGLISRLPSAVDQRVVEVFIEPEGLAIVGTLSPEAARIQKLMMKAFREAELPLLKDFLRRLYVVVTALNEDRAEERPRKPVSANDRS